MDWLSWYHLISLILINLIIAITLQPLFPTLFKNKPKKWNFYNLHLISSQLCLSLFKMFLNYILCFSIGLILFVIISHSYRFYKFYISLSWISFTVLFVAKLFIIFTVLFCVCVTVFAINPTKNPTKNAITIITIFLISSCLWYTSLS